MLISRGCVALVYSNSLLLFPNHARNWFLVELPFPPRKRGKQEEKLTVVVSISNHYWKETLADHWTCQFLLSQIKILIIFTLVFVTTDVWSFMLVWAIKILLAFYLYICPLEQISSLVLLSCPPHRAFLLYGPP